VDDHQLGYITKLGKSIPLLGNSLKGLETSNQLSIITINSFSHKQGRGSPLPTSVHATASQLQMHTNEDSILVAKV